MGGAHLCAKLKVDFSQTEVAVKDFEAFFLGGVNFSFFTKVALMSNSSRTRVELESNKSEGVLKNAEVAHTEVPHISRALRIAATRTKQKRT